jgi:hypothetical protein
MRKQKYTPKGVYFCLLAKSGAQKQRGGEHTIVVGKLPNFIKTV